MLTLLIFFATTGLCASGTSTPGNFAVTVVNLGEMADNLIGNAKLRAQGMKKRSQDRAGQMTQGIN
jgi:hypothetical protein